MRFLLPLLALLVAACGSQAPRPTIDRAEVPAVAVPPAPTSAPAPRRSGAPAKFGGGYKDDGPGDGPTVDPDTVPDAVPRIEPLHRFANKPYSALGRDYVPLRELTPYKGRGIGSWYGRRYHGQKTSSGEIYDMYGMTAAHPILPIPSYARVTNPANGRSVVVRINDRGPFHAGREIDLSWTAAYKLDYLAQGRALVEVESILPGQAPAAAPSPQATALAPPPEDEDPIARLAAAPPEPAETPGDRSGHYLQLGAFGNRDNAESLRGRLARELGELAPMLSVHAAGPLFRVQLGPWADAATARQAGERLRQDIGMEPVIVQR